MAANNSIIVQIRRGTTAQTSSFIGALAELTVDTDQKTLVVHDGVTPGGNYLSTKDFTQQVYNFANTLSGGASTDNVARDLAQTAFNTANGANGLAASAYNQANTNAGAIAIIQGTDATQNTRLDSIETINAEQNTSISIINGINATQNTRLNSIETVNSNQNTSINIIEGVDLTQNTRLNSIESVNLEQNTAISVIQGVDSWQNTQITAVNNYAASAYNKANTGGVFTGSVTINQDLTVSGNVTITGNIISQGAEDLVINDPLIYIANNNLGNSVDIGLIGNFNDGTYQHTGLVRDASSNEWKLFSNVTSEPTTTVDFTNAIWDNLQLGTLTGNVIAQTVIVNGVDFTQSQLTQNNNITAVNNYAASAYNQANTNATNITYVNQFAASAYNTANGANGLAAGAYNQANTGTSIAEAAFSFANTLSGGASTDNVARALAQSAYNSSNLVNQFAASAYTTANGANGLAAGAYNTANGANGLAAGAYNQANTNADAISVIGGVNATQNTRLNSIETINTNQNTSISIIEGVNLGQNTTITQVNQFAQAAYNTANIKFNIAGGIISGDVAVTGNLTVSGETFYANVKNINVDDSFISLNANTTGSPVFDAGIEVDRGTANNVFFYWNELDKAWEYTDNLQNNETVASQNYVGSTISSSIAPVNQFAQSAYTTANGANGLAAGAYNTANGANGLAAGAFNKANTSLQNSGNQVLTGNLSVTGSITSGNWANSVYSYVSDKLYAGISPFLSTPLPDLIAQFTGNSATYVQVNSENINPLGSADYVVTADVGDDATFFIDLGLQNSQATTGNLKPLDGYLIVQGNTGQIGGNLIVGTSSATPGQQTRIISGGLNDENVVITFNDDLSTQFYGNAIPINDNTQYLGSTTNRWHTIYVGPGSVDIDNIVLSNNNGKLVISGASDIVIAGSSVPPTSDISNKANNAYDKANAAFDSSNSVNQFAQSAYTTANGANGLAAGAYNQANTNATNITYVNQFAQAAYNTANSKFSSSGGAISGDVNITGNLSVTGTTFYANTEQLHVKDNIITLNSNVTGTPTLDAGIEINRGIETNTVLKWSEVNHAWQFTNDGTNFFRIADTDRVNSAFSLANTNASDIAIIQGVNLGQNTTITQVNQFAASAYNTANGANGLAAGAFNTANGANGLAAGAFNTANGANGLAAGAFNKANTNADAIAVIEAVNLTQNTNITQVNQFAASAYNTANGANGLAASAFNKANTNADAIAIIQSVDSWQNTEITAVNNYVASAYNTANGANGLAAGAFDKANSTYSYATQVQVIADNAYNKANAAFDSSNAVNGYAQSAYATANGANGLAQGAYNLANTNSGAIAIIQSVNETQNTRLSSIETINTNQNTSISIIEGVDTWQNTQITAVNEFAASAYNTANAANGLAAGAYNQANTNATNITYVNQYAESAYAKANTNFDAIAIIQGVDLGQNSTITAVNQFAAGAYNAANTGYNFVTTGGTVTGNVTINGSLDVTGNVTFTGNVTNVTITGNTGQFFGNTITGFNALFSGIPGYDFQPQTVFQVAGNFDGYSQVNNQNINSGQDASTDFVATADNGNELNTFIDMGINSSTYSNPDFSLTGPNDGYLYVHGNTAIGGGNLVLSTIHDNDIIFSVNGVKTENEVMRIASSNTVTIKSGIESTSIGSGSLVVNGGVGVTGTLWAAQVVSNNVNLYNLSTTIFNATNTAIGIAQAAFDQANVTVGVDATQNNNITAVNNFAASAYNTANGANGLATAAYGHANNAYNYANTQIGIIQGVDLTQNNRISIIESVDLTQNANIIAVNNYAASAYAQANTANTRAFNTVLKSGDTMTGSLTGVTTLGATTISLSQVDSTSNTFTTSSTTQVSVDAWPIATYRSAKYFVQITSGTDYHVIELNLVHNGTTVWLAQYGEITTNTSLGTFDADISGGTVRLLFTGTNAVSTVKLLRTVVDV